MQNPPPFSRKLAIALALLLFSSPATLHASWWLGPAVQLVKYLASGETRFTLNHSIDYWQVYFTGLYRSEPFGALYYFYYDPVTDEKHYTTRNYIPGTGYVEHHDTFTFASAPARRLYFCGWSETVDDEDGNPVTLLYEYETMEDHRLIFWASSFTQSGLNPPAPPYNCYMETLANRLQSDCSAVVPYSFRSSNYFSVNVRLDAGG